MESFQDMGAAITVIIAYIIGGIAINALTALQYARFVDRMVWPSLALAAYFSPITAAVAFLILVFVVVFMAIFSLTLDDEQTTGSPYFKKLLFRIGKYLTH